MKKIIFFVFLITLTYSVCFSQNLQLKVNWNETAMVSKSTPTLQVVVNPMIRPKGAMHDAAIKALHDINANFVRYVPWIPYPKLAVAELKEPDKKNTYWNFSLIDPITIGFLNATKGHCPIMNFSTIPEWMFKTEKPVIYPEDPNQVTWNYSTGTQLRDTTMKELTDYYVRLISWYTKGGFTDELGKYHKSDYHYKIPYWEILNEPDLEHSMTPQTYTKIYDAMVGAIKTVLPETKFVGMAIAYVKPEWFEYFLNPIHHKPNIPIDMISYHFYANGNGNPKFDASDSTFLDKAEGFVRSVRQIEGIRKRLAPNTKTDINELGTFLSDEARSKPIPPIYWNLSASIYAYLFIELTKLGIDIIGESQLVGYPTQFPDVSMINYKDNKPNARFWVLKLIKDNIQPGSKLVNSNIQEDSSGDILAKAFINHKNKKLVLVVNKRNKTIDVKLLAEFKGAKVSTIDETTRNNAATQSKLTDSILELKPFAVKLIMLTK